MNWQLVSGRDGRFPRTVRPGPKWKQLVFRWCKMAACAMLRRRNYPQIALLAAIFMASPAFAEAANPQRLTAYPGGHWEPPAARFGVTVTRGVEVVMSDGAKLPVDIYVPLDKTTGRPANGKFPVLLTRYWYTKPLLDGHSFARQDPDYFVERGYIYVSADVRGTGRSTDPGSYLGERDARDGAELVRWTTTLPGASGVVGLIGCSAMGQTQLSTGAVLGPGSPVKAMIPACVPGDQYRDTYTENGVWRPTWQGLLMSASTVFGTGMVADFSRTYLESQQGGDAAFDRAWWAQRNFVRQAEPIVASGAAILLWNGWQDVGYGGLEVLSALQNAAFRRASTAPLSAKTPVSGKYQLILGDWGHGGGLDKAIQLQWFETWLKGVETGLATRTRTPIHIQDRVTKQWFNFGSYPLVDAYTALYLGAGTLQADPSEPGRDTIPWERSREAAVDYVGASYERPMRVAGPIGVRLNASSSNTDAQFRFELADIAPDGARVVLSHAMILGSMHELDTGQTWRDGEGNPVRPVSSLRADKPLVPDRTVGFEVMLPPTVWTLEPGHRIALRVSSRPRGEDCPMFPMTGGDPTTGCTLRPSQVARLAGGVYTIVRGGRRPSLLNLPLVPAGEFQPVRSGRTPTSDQSLPLEW